MRQISVSSYSSKSFTEPNPVILFDDGPISFSSEVFKESEDEEEEDEEVKKPSRNSQKRHITSVLNQKF